MPLTGGRVSSILIVTDAWHPRVNGVVRTLEETQKALLAMDVRTEVIHPGAFRSVPCPTYPEIRLALPSQRRLIRRIATAACDHIHIATEGPLGHAAAAAARRMRRRYSTCYHSRFPEYLAARLPIPTRLSYAVLRRFHNKGAACLVATQTLKDDLVARGFRTLHRWPRGVDTALFHPGAGPSPYDGLARPVWLSVGRVAVEKTLPAFLDLDLPGTKVVVGDGPDLPRLRDRYSNLVFAGAKAGSELAAHYAHADAFVFPSRTDTFGLVMAEAMAAGTPVAAFPVPGPIDVVQDGVTGVLAHDLRAAALAALDVSRDACRNAAQSMDWRNATQVFLAVATAVEAQRG